MLVSAQVIRVPTKIAFRDCVHHSVAGPTPDHILAQVRAEYCLPRPELPGARSSASATPAIQLEDFAALARALGQDAFRQLASDLLRRRDEDATLEHLPEFLSRHRHGRATPALADLARLDLALAMSDHAPPARSIGACCLPPELLRAHPDLTVALHPAWRWLDLTVPADAWRDELLAGMEVPPPPAPRSTFLRVHPYRGEAVSQGVSPDAFAFEQALWRGANLRQAKTLIGNGLEPIQHLQSLLMEGAIIGVQLHPISGDSDKAASHVPPALQSNEVTS